MAWGVCALAAAAWAGTGTGAALPRARAPRGISLELPAATLGEAVAALSAALGVLVEPPRPVEPAATRLDFTRRARFAVHETTPGAALRELMRIYRCGLMWAPSPSGKGYGYRVTLPTGLQGAEARVPGYAVRLSELRFTDLRSFDEDAPTVYAERTVGLELTVRADGGDVAAIESVDAVRIVDQAGRDALGRPDEREEDAEAERADDSLPDEVRRRFTCEWPYPAPRRVRLVEGELVLFRRTRRVAVRVPAPVEGGTPTRVSFPDGQVQLIEDLAAQRYLLRITHAQEQTLTMAGELTPVRGRMADGTEVALHAEVMGRGVVNGNVVEEIWIGIEHVPEPPQELEVNFSLGWNPGRRLRFRLEEPTAELTPGTEGQAAGAPSRGAAVGPPPGSRPARPRATPGRRGRG